MSLSKPFPVFNLPIIPLEHVLLLLDPFDLLLIALNSSKKVREQLSKLALVKYFDIRVCLSSVVFSFRLKSGKLIKWSFDMKYNANEDKTIGDEGKTWLEYSEKCYENEYKDKKIRILEFYDMSMDLLKYPNGIKCRLSRTHFSEYAQRIGHFLLSIFPCRRIRKLGAGMLGLHHVIDTTWFHMENITNCDKFRFVLGDGDQLSEMMEKTNIKKKITLECHWDSAEASSLEWMNNEKIRNIPHLSILFVRNLSLTQFLSLENEQLHLNRCRTQLSYLNEYLKKWTNGEFTKRRTLKVTDYYETRLDDPMVLDGLTQESVEVWEKTGEPRLVRFSDKIYLNPTPVTVPLKYRTVRLKNCHGQFATVVQTYYRPKKFYFAPWDLPIPPINIPVNHKLFESSAGPAAKIVHRDRQFVNLLYHFPEYIR